VIERAGFRPSSHAHKNLLSVLQLYPRDELFHVDIDTLYETALGVCAWATAAGPASSSAATSSPASIRASSTCRARTTTPTCA
jgi:hypothetical protein